MVVKIEDLPDVPEWILALLADHLPFSLPLLRRLQSAHRLRDASTPAARILLAYTPEAADVGADPTGPPPAPARFAAAYVDPSRGPETESWLYSTLEDDNDSTSSSGAAAPAACVVEQVLALLRRMRKIEAEYAGTATAAPERDPDPGARRPGTVLMGSLHEAVRQALIGTGVSVRATGVAPKGMGWDFYDKWLFRVEDLAGAGGGGGGELPAGMRWDAIRDSGDAALVRSRTAIPRKECVSPRLP